MAIKHGTINMTVVKWGTSSLTTVNYGSKKVFPDTSYDQLDLSISYDPQESQFVLYIQNSNTFDVNIDCDFYWETSTGDGSESFSVWVDYRDQKYAYFGDPGTNNVYYASATLNISGGGFSWSQTADEDFR